MSARDLMPVEDWLSLILFVLVLIWWRLDNPKDPRDRR
jgi:hypothetical protein